MTTAILYSFRRCPYAMRARMALAISGTDHEHREIILRDKPPSMLAYSPKGTVPVFVTAEGAVIDESEDMMLLALSQNDPGGWLGDDTDQQLKLMRTITTDFKYHLDRYKYASRYKDDVNRGSIDLSHRDSACDVLQEFETILSGSQYLTGDRPRLADYGTFPFIRQFANVEPDWWNTPVFPSLKRWLDGLVTSDLFTQIMAKHDLWVEPE